jgi:hypothetical protein
MSESARSIFSKVRALLNTYTEDGVQIPEPDYIDMQEKAIPLIDMGHKELYEMARTDLAKEEPDTITDIEDITEVNYKADQAIVYYVAARLAPFKKKDLVTFFEDKFEQLKSTCKNKAVAVPITDAYAESDNNG